MGSTAPEASHRARSRRIAANVLASVLGAALVGIVGYYATHRPHGASKVVLQTKDEVYYSHSATSQDAEALGAALELTGFFNGRGVAVQLSKGTSGTIVSFVLNEGGWNHPMTVLSFEEIARRCANSIGGFPVHVRLCDSAWGVHKEVIVGKVDAGGKDEVYYYGSATDAEAGALARALQAAGYLTGAGVSVTLTKDNGTAIGFVLGNGAWDQPGSVSGFEAIARRVAPAVGGPPVELRLLNSQMEVEKEIPNVR